MSLKLGVKESRKYQKEVVMKKAMLVAAAAVIMVLFVVGGAYAGTINPTVAVNGSVSGLCKAGTAGILTFAITDPSFAGGYTASVTDATVLCTKNTTFTVTAQSLNNPAAPATCGGAGITGALKESVSGYLMNYTFTCGNPSGTGAGFGAGTAQNLNLAGSIAQAAYQNAPVSATYGDTVTLTITY